MKDQIKNIWTSDKSLSVLLWVLGIGIFGVVPTAAIGHAPAWERTVLAGTFTVIAISGVLSTWSNPGTRRFLLMVGSVPLALFWVEIVYHPPLLSLASGGVRIGMVGAFGAVLLGRVLAPGRVTGERIKGALAVYLLIGLLFEEGYRLLSIAFAGSLSVHSTDPMSVHFTAELMYFSFSTLTTAGYGDIVPLHPLARSMANLEAITGQMYIVLLIGRLLTVHLSQSDSGKG